MTKTQRSINLQYALTQGFYWMGYCGVFRYAVVYLQSLGYSNAQLGLVTALGCVLGFLLPQLLAVLIDRSRRVTVYRCLWGLLLGQAVVVLLLRGRVGQSALNALLYVLLLALEFSINPMNTQMSVELERVFGGIHYGAARGFGSLVFSPVSILLGILVERHGTSLLLGVDLLFVLLRSLALLSICLRLRRAGEGRSAAALPEKDSTPLPDFVRRNGRFFVVLVGTMLLYFSHNLVNNFFINVVRNVGGDASDMGSLFGFMAMLEFPAMLIYDRLSGRLRCGKVLRFSAVAFVLKALAMALAGSMTWLYIGSVTHGFAYGLITPVMVHYVRLYIPEEDSAKGQSLAFGMVTLGNVFASLIGGVLYDALGVGLTLWFGVGAALLGLALCHLFAHRA